MITGIFVGYVKSTKDESKRLVSCAISKLEAGNLMEQWIKDYDPTSLNWEAGEVETIVGSDYIKKDLLTSLEAKLSKPGELITTTISHNLEQSEQIRNICNAYRLDYPEEAISLLLEQSEIRQFKKKFKRPKFWFGDRLRLKNNRVGLVQGMEWRDSDAGITPGWWYRIQCSDRVSFQTVHQDSLSLIEIES